MQIGDYVIKPTSNSAEKKLIEFIKFNGFNHALKFENSHTIDNRLLVINVIRKTYFYIDKHNLSSNLINEKTFYENVNYYPKGKIMHKKIFTKDDNLLYEGYTINNKPFGFGILYYSNGNKYWEGIFDYKGIIQGKEYYSNGKLRFEGIWKVTSGYCKDTPERGNLFNKEGELIFSGKFELKRGGVGYLMVKHPKIYYELEEDSPKIEFVWAYDLKECGVKSNYPWLNDDI
ncbi:hypothetical protein [Methanobrevibacter millerae]|uniref:MORN repeat-containing protein n=1 Tax=Methanobrevibacter millerae TaxID=230361 RepID=A0A0U3EI97_9EURY|nr:hypothetical protein [Methanobrevibacter millerae]ALT68269.1 hypothetical protein sm9_0467 [Methanobrevibacter millerae]